jgi:hypothetical protein
MGQTNITQNQNVPFIHNEDTLVRTGTIAQDATRTVDLLQNTVMAYNATNQNWVPFTALADTEGESMPRGIYLGEDIPFADLVAGDIEDASILVKNGIVNRDMVVWDQDLQTAESVVNPGTVNATSAEMALIETANITFEDVEAISEQVE